MKMNLSKSKYKQYWQCPKMLWMDTYQKEWEKQDANAEQRLKEGSKESKIKKQELEVEKYKKYYELELRKLEDMKKKFEIEGESNG